MSPKLPRITAREIVAVLEGRGFRLSRSSGSHQIFKDESGRRATVPVHSGKILHPKVLQNILRDADMTAEELTDELR